jgi:hypothetical protein
MGSQQAVVGGAAAQAGALVEEREVGLGRRKIDDALGAQGLEHSCGLALGGLVGWTWSRCFAPRSLRREASVVGGPGTSRGHTRRLRAEQWLDDAKAALDHRLGGGSFHR